MDLQTFDRIWLNARNLIGERVRVRGGLFSKGTSFIATDFASCAAGQRMLLRDKGAIEKYLLKILPASGGGPFIYNEVITVTGTVQRREDGFELAALSDCRVTSSDPAMEVEIPNCFEETA